MGFRLKSGNRTSFKQMGGTEVSPAKNMKTGSYKQSFESPAKQKVNKGGEAQDQDKIVDDKGNHIGNWVNGKKVMFNDKPAIDPKLKNVEIKKPKTKILVDDVPKKKGGATCAKCGVKSIDHKSTTHAFTTSAHDPDWEGGDTFDVKPKPQSPAKQTKDTFKDGSKKSSRDKFNDTETAIEQRKADRKDDQKYPYPRKFTNKGVKTIVGEKTSGFGPISVNSTLTRKQKATSRAEMSGIDSKSPYWYKVNGKTVSKNQYLNYENKPGGDEPGKQTNHPDVYGRIKNNHGRGPKTK